MANGDKGNEGKGRERCPKRCAEEIERDGGYEKRGHGRKRHIMRCEKQETHHAGCDQSNAKVDDVDR